MFFEARRSIMTGEQICYHYAICEAHPYLNFNSLCGARNCRTSKATGDDWTIGDLQQEYAGHVFPHVAKLIAKHERCWKFVVI
jgi:hypothetical protein